MRLLVTRAEPDATALAEDLRALGHEPLLQPLLDFRSLDFDPRPLKSAGAIVVTSSSALRAFEERLDVADIAHIPLFCVGSETSRRARVLGFASVSEGASTALELAAKLLQSAEQGKNLVYAAGRHRAFDLEGMLARSGFFVRTLCVYAMEARPSFEGHIVRRFEKGGIDGVLLMSPRTADIYVNLCRTHKLMANAKALAYFCLAESIAAKLAPVAPNMICIAAKPDREALLQLLDARTRTLPSHDPDFEV